MLNQGDGIKGEMLSGFSEKPMKSNQVEVKTGSSTHKAQFVTTRGFTYVRIERTYPTIPRD